MNRFFGDQPGTVFARLAVASFVVGVLLSFFGVSPFEIVEGLTRLIGRIYNMGFEAVEWLIRYVVLGAIIVVPIWIVMRLWKFVTQKRGIDGRRTDRDAT